MGQLGNSDGRAWVLWDGECGFCRRSVAWAVRRDIHNRLRPSPYQLAPSPPMTPRLARACQNAVHVVAPDGQTYKAGRAALYILRAIGWPAPVVTALGLPPLVWLVEIGYRIVANNRPFLSKYLFTNMSVDPSAVGEGPGGP